MNKREQYLREFTFALTVGGVLAILLCMVLPEVQTKADVFGFYFPFWFFGTITIWEIIDTVDLLRKERRKRHAA